ncbi:hypothetical protein [Lyngbya sp. CCY1209]|uniref:tetratricopeptide repeat protein n=1 Tax=Lyngbya sp. CCY1209 TaxID=2886103 RepID=UPI002D2106F7|nr:hypothetical protein [Lyngbya sp. CCY1209]MEB3883399.1 hypothetical protein [Lyngbya sp. CCY1209]
MDAETALKFIEDLLIRQFAYQLTETEQKIFKGSWENLSYDKIMDEFKIHNDDAEFRKVGSALWKRIGNLFDLPDGQVTKRKFRGIVEQQWRLKQEQELDISDHPTISPPQNIERLTDRDFVGREEAIADLDRLVERGATCILIQSPGGVGKTVLAERYLTQRFSQPPLRFDIAKDAKNINSAEGWIEQNLRKLGEEPGREFLVSCDRLREKLQSEAIGILVDNLEPALDKDGKFIADHRSYVELLRVLCDRSLKSLTLITSRERVCESLDIVLYPLKVLSVEAWREYFSQQELNADSPVLAEIHQAYGGNALAMNILRERIALDYERDIEDYWEIHYTEEGVSVETAVHNLLVEQFGRLESVDLMAYQLLCRMGCFRYQDVPTVPRDGLLCLLWDVPKRDASGAIERLWKRGLIERVNREYKLHPLIRQEAFERSKISEDREKANRTVARFWTQIVDTIDTGKDAITALEAYYHYLQIEDFNGAADVIATERDHIYEMGEPLGCSFYRLGLLIQIEQAINAIKDKVKVSFSLGRLYNVLGDTYWMMGRLQDSLFAHKKLAEIAKKLEESYKNDEKDPKIYRLYIVSFLSQALCKLELLEFEEAIELLEFHISLIDRSKSLPISDVYSMLSFCYSSINESAKSQIFLKRSMNDFDREFDRISSIQAGIWYTSYYYIFTGKTCYNLKDIDGAKTQYNTAISFADETNYLQVKAKGFMGLGEIYMRSDVSTALNYHDEATKILEKIGAKCDLAEAYYQLGLTYQVMGEIANSQDYFNRAIALWEKIDAPLQIERVRRSMNHLS